MLGILLIYFIGKYFYDLAEKHERSNWGFAILGVLSYYFGTFVAGIIITIGLDLWGTISVDDLSDLMLGLIALPFGIATTIVFYHVLKNSWEKKAVADETIIDHLDGF